MAMAGHQLGFVGGPNIGGVMANIQKNLETMFGIARSFRGSSMIGVLISFL